MTALAWSISSVTPAKSSYSKRYVKLAIGYESGPGALTSETPTQLSFAAGRPPATPPDAADMLSSVGSMNADFSAFWTDANDIPVWNAYASSM